jgi:hypothetical protein
LISTLAPSAAAAAAVAASAAVGSLRCEVASPQPPTAAMSGHFDLPGGREHEDRRQLPPVHALEQLEGGAVQLGKLVEKL